MRSTAGMQSGRHAARLRGLRRRAAMWKRRARAAVAAALIAATAMEFPAQAVAQMGQSAMAPSGGVVNSAVQGLSNLNQNGPGILYYGINAADRGLGYQGSYMTLGGYVPGFEDSLGGLWAADLRSHLSVYGGFFSNVGAVRKQMLGGTILGVGVYWDYDGDLNQYADTMIPYTSTVFGGGQVYNQVGISGEWLTDFGNLRSNGYIPVGTTAEYVGPYVENVVLCQNGVNAGLGGTDLELGAYIPGLSDWAGMISVGGYAYGNTRYTFPTGQGVVPWFGGVYTRLDMTLVNNWDFSLQYNNDSYFDSTGFARLTYRMGGSRRRNVPDQMEQPMMRNEHIVRAHQTPVVATNPETGTAWRVFHVDNAGTGPGAGTAESPFTSLSSAETAANLPYDIVYVHQGNSGVNPYVTPTDGYSFQAANQYLIGQGSSIAIPTVTCGNRSFFNQIGTSAYPVLTNPIGPAIAVDQPGTIVSHFQIQGAPIGITDGNGFVGGVATVSDVIVVGQNLGQRGVDISKSTGTFVLDRLQLLDLDNDGLVLSAVGGTVAVTSSTFSNIGGRAVAITGDDARAVVSTSTIDRTVGTAMAIEGDGARVVLTSSTISNTDGNAVVASGVLSAVQITDSSIVSSGSTVMNTAVVASGTGAVTSIQRSTISTTGSTGILASGEGSFVFFDASTLDEAGGNGIMASGARAQLYVTGSSKITNAQANAIQVVGIDNKLLVQDSTIQGAGNNGINIAPNGVPIASQATILRSSINQSGNTGIAVRDAGGPNDVVQVYGSRISGASLAGISALNSNVDVGPDPTVRNGAQTTIVSTGVNGVSVNGASTVNVSRTAISAVDVGINAVNGIAGSTTNLTAANNTITVSGSNAGIVIAAITGTTPPNPINNINVQVLSNRITTSGSAGITLTSIVPPPAPAPFPRAISVAEAVDRFDLGARNYGTSVLETPTPNPVSAPPQPTLIEWGAVAPPLPPALPILTRP